MLLCWTTTGFSPAALICATACACGSPFTCGTKALLPLLPVSITAATAIAAITAQQGDEPGQPAPCPAAPRLVVPAVVAAVPGLLVRGDRGLGPAHHGLRSHPLGPVGVAVVVGAGGRRGHRGHLHAGGRALDVGIHLRGGLVPVVRRLGHGLEHDGVRPRRHVRVQPGRRDRVLPDVLVGDRHRRVAGERRPAGEQLVHQAAGGVQVAARVHPLAPGLLRRQVLRGADDLRGLGHRGLGVAHRPGDAEVHHLDVAVAGDHHVPGLDVPVHDARLVAVLKGAQHAADDLQGALGQQPVALRSAGP